MRFIHPENGLLGWTAVCCISHAVHMPHEMPAATSQMSPGLGKESLFPFEIVHPNLVEHKELGMYRHASVQSRAFESPAPIPVVEKRDSCFGVSLL